MKIKLLLVALFVLVTSNTIFSQSVVVNKYQNVGSTADIVELLVVQDNADLRNLVVKTFSSNNANDNGGSISFNNIAFWSSMRAGTLIIIRFTSTGATDITTSCTDFLLDIGGSNATYFTVNAGTFDLAGNDMCMVKSGTNTGNANNIHTLRAGSAAAQWTGITGGTRLGTTTTCTGGNFATVDNANSVIGDYDLNTTGVTVGTGYTFGSGNNANNTNFINFLRGPVSSAATSITDTSFYANWGAVTGAASYVLDVSTVSNFASFVSGYNGLNVGNVTTYNVTGLSTGPYYFRVRAVNATPTTSGNSCTQTVVMARVTAANGDWNVGATWVGGVVPSSSENVFIKHSIYLTGTASTTTRDAGTATTVDVGATLATANVGVSNSNTYANNGTTTINGTFRIEDLNIAGTVSIITGNNFVYGSAGTLQFNNTLPLGRIVNNTDKYWPTTNGPFNVTVSRGGISMQAGATRTVNGALITPATAALTTVGVKTIAASSDITINGTLTVYGITSIQTASPIYTANSTLIYSITAPATAYNRTLEWNASGIGTIGVTPGYPNNVQISNNTTIAYSTTTGIQRAINGNLTIDLGSTLDMRVSPTLPNAEFTIGGSVTNNGTFRFPRGNGGNVVVLGNFTNSGSVAMSTTALQGGHLKLAGNFSNTGAGTLTSIDRSIYFTKTGVAQTQTVASTTALTFPYVYIDGTDTTVQLLNNLTISAPNAAVNGGVAITYANAADLIDINGRTLTIGTAAVANTISGSGGFKGSTSSTLSLLGTGSIGTLKFAGNLNLGTFTINRTASTVGCVMGSALTVNTDLVLTNGLIDLGANTMTLASTCTNSFTASASSFVIANVTAGGVLSKAITATGTAYLFPIGDNTGTAEYTPATVNYTAGTFDATSFLGLSVEDGAETNLNAPSDYLTRYWSLTNVGTFTTPTYNFDATYIDTTSDVTGTVSAYYKSNQWDGSDWTNGGTMIGSGALNISGCTLATGTNHITAGIRDREIDVRGGGNIIASGATTTSGLNGTAFGSQTIGTPTVNTFTIHNRGGVSLSLTGAPLVVIGGANASDFVVTAVPGTSTITAESSTTFQITFTPSYAGYRTATVSIANNDSNENPYTFVIDGTGDCAVVAVNTITPTSGPVGTEVSVTATANNLTAATVTFNGIAATVTQIDATHITAIVPAGAVSGNILTTNNLGCQAANTFTVIDNASTSCEGSLVASDLFFSEVTDSNTGGLTYVEIYNGTGVAKNLGGYIIKLAANGSATYSSTLTLSSVSLPSGSTYVVALGDDNLCGTYGGDGNLAAQINGGLGINFDTYVVGPPSKGNDHYALFNGVTQIDSWGTYLNPSWAPASIGTEGATFRRKNTVTAPNTTYSNSDWNIVDFYGKGSTYCVNNDYSDIGTYNFRAGVPPTVTALSYTPTCKATTLTVAGTPGFTGGFGIVYKWYAVQNGSNTWNLISNGGIYSGANTGSLYISNIATVIDYQFYCQVWEDAATCYKASNAIKITAGQSTTWLASPVNTWSNFAPDINTAVIIDNDYDTANGFSPSFDACSLTINSGKTVTIRANNYANIQNDLTVTGNLTVENNGSLVMIDDNGVVTNTGTTEIKRTATNIRGYDYVYWSSPVIGQTIETMYSSPTSGFKFFWNPVGANINSPISTGNWFAASGIMAPGTGYIVRGSSNYGMAASSIPSIFTGAVNSGIVPVSIGRGNNTALTTTGSGNGVTVTNFDDNWNLVGNPYPSAINAMDFLTYNTNLQGFIYLWKHNNIPVSLANPFYGSFLYDYNPSDYLAYNKLGAQTQNGFDGYVASGQGFFILMNDGVYDTSQTAIFKNSMRSKTYGNTQFYKTANSTTSIDDERHRIWLDLVDSNNQSERTLVGYAPEATVGLDRLYDAIKNVANAKNIYSLAENTTLIIQGRPTPFDENDQVPIGVRIMLAGNYKIAIAAVDGLFEEGQPIYLEDRELNIIHDLRAAPYSFAANAGTFDNRFLLRYTNEALGTPDFGTIDGNVVVAINHGEMTIKSFVENIQEVTVYDVLGRQLYFEKAINNNNFVTSNISMSHQTLIVKIMLENGMTISRKIIL